MSSGIRLRFLMILDALLWLPVKVARHFLQPVTAMLDSLAEAVDHFDDHGEQQKEHGI